MNNPELHRQNFVEHGFDVKIDVEYDCGHSIYYGYLHDITVDTNVKYAKTAIVIENVVTAMNNEKDNKLVFCNPKSRTILTLGNKTLNLRFYTKEDVIKVLKEIGIKLCDEVC